MGRLIGKRGGGSRIGRWKGGNMCGKEGLKGGLGMASGLKGGLCRASGLKGDRSGWGLKLKKLLGSGGGGLTGDSASAFFRFRLRISFRTRRLMPWSLVVGVAEDGGDEGVETLISIRGEGTHGGVGGEGG